MDSQFAYALLADVLTPLLSMVTNIARFVGIGFIIAGLVRLHRASAQTMMYRVSPMGTGIMFVAGVIFIAYTPYLLSFSNSLFNDTGMADVLSYSSADSICAGGTATSSSQVDDYVDPHPFCPILAYAQINFPGSTENRALKEVVFGTMMFVGVISFLRGVAQMIKVGEGGQQGGLVKAVTHIVAGIIGVNAPLFYDLLINVYKGLVPT